MPTPAARAALEMRPATPDDLDAIVGLLHQADEWLIQRGITDQWIAPFRADTIKPLIERGEVYIGTRDGDPIATFTLTYRPDPELWGHQPDDAGYVRRLAVDRAHAGADVGCQLLDHASQIVAATGRPWLRLDCAKHNRRLHDYNRAHGFTPLRTVDLRHRQSGALFQRSAPQP